MKILLHCDKEELSFALGFPWVILFDDVSWSQKEDTAVPLVTARTLPGDSVTHTAVRTILVIL